MLSKYNSHDTLSYMSTQRVHSERETRAHARMHSRESLMSEQSVSHDAQPAQPATVIEAGEKLTPAAAARKMSNASKPARKPATKRSSTKPATKPATRSATKPATKRDDTMSESQ